MKDDKNSPITDLTNPISPPAGGPKAPNINQVQQHAATNQQAPPLSPPYPQPSQPYMPQPSQPYIPQPSQPYIPQPSQPYIPQPSQPYIPQPSQPSLGYAVPQMQLQMQQMQNQIAQLQQQVQVSQAIAVKEKSRAEEFYNMSQRLQADFDNYRKRTLENNKRLKEDGIVEVIEKLVNILDVFKRAISMIADVNIQDGVKMIYRQLNDVLTSFGVSEIPALGEMFDPELHNAIMTVKVKDKEKSGTIVEILQKGYIMDNRVIRHTAVKVAN